MATSSNTIETDMDDWPKFIDEETGVQHLNLLRSRLTIDMATRLCDICPINRYYNSHFLHCRRAMQAYLQLLLGILPLVPRSTFLRMFPKGCGGCAIYQFYAIAALHPSLDVEVHSLLKALLFDEQERILSMIPNIQQIALMIERGYKRRDYPFPYVANCLDLEKTNQGSKVVKALGEMIRSDRFLDLMQNEIERALQIVQRMITSSEDPFWAERELSRLLDNQ